MSRSSRRDRVASHPPITRPSSRAARASSSMRRIAVAGAPAVRGHQYGRLARPLVHRCIAAYRDVFEHRAGLPWPAAIAHAKSFVEAIGDFGTESLEEMRSIGDGAGVTF